MSTPSAHATLVPREVVLADFIPFSSHVTDRVIRTREGDYIQIWKVPGIAFETADPVDILARHVTFNQLVRNLPGGHVALWTHRLRRGTTDRFETTYANRFCQDLAERYYASFTGYTMMTNELYVSVVYAAIREGGYAGLTGPAQALRAQSKLYDCEDQHGIDQRVCQRALNKPFQDKALGLQAYQTELGELDRIERLMQHIDTTRDPKGIAELQARIQSESVAVGNEMTKLQMFKMLAETEDHLIAEQQTELLLKRAGNTRRLQDQMVPVTFGR